MPTINQRRFAVSLVAAALAAPLSAAFAASDARVDSAAADRERKVLNIRGSGFAKDRNLKVYFGGYANPLAIRSLTDTMLEALLPTGLAPGSYHIVVGDDEAFAITLGPVGPAGDAGAAGAAGIAGAAGPRGNDGQVPTLSPLVVGSAECAQGGTKIATEKSANAVCHGASGAAGAVGAAGAAGPAGAKGANGDTGPIGGIGPRGVTGDDGPGGAAGPQGPQGDAGARGPEGPKGSRGNAGPQGARGPTGTAPVVNGPGLWQGPQGPRGLTGYPGTYVQLARWWANQGSPAVPMGSEATLGVGQVGPTHIQFIPRGDLIVHVDAMAIMTADWFGCELKLKLVIEDLYGIGHDFVSLPYYRYLPRGIERHVSYTIAVPDVDKFGYEVRLVGTSDCPGTTLSQVTIGGQWLNRLP